MALVIVVLPFGSQASADTSGCYPSCQPPAPAVSPATGSVTHAPTAPSTGAAANGSNGSSGSLAFTGEDVAGIVTVGVVLVAGGTLAVGVTRRRRHTD